MLKLTAFSSLFGRCRLRRKEQIEETLKQNVLKERKVIVSNHDGEIQTEGGRDLEFKIMNFITSVLHF